MTKIPLYKWVEKFTWKSTFETMNNWGKIATDSR